MSIFDRPFFESQRERSFRERNRDSDRRRYGRRHEDDERGGRMSRDRDDFERERGDFRGRDPYEHESRDWREPFDEPRERASHFGRERFEQFEDWERPLELTPEFRYRRSFGGGGGDYGRHAYRGSSFRPGRFESLEPEGRYAGCGPKGYQRSDERIKEEVCDRLTADPHIDATEIEVDVESGEVTVQGSVRGRSMKRAVEDCVESIAGVQQLHNRLRVEPVDDRGESRFASESNEGQRSSAWRKTH